MGLEAPIALVVILCALAWCLGGIMWGVLSKASSPSDEPEVCSRCKRVNNFEKRWLSVHERFHPDRPAKKCTPCLNPQCKHTCEEHEQYRGSHDRRFMCHARGCECTKFERLVVSDTLPWGR